MVQHNFFRFASNFYIFSNHFFRATLENCYSSFKCVIQKIKIKSSWKYRFPKKKR